MSKQSLLKQLDTFAQLAALGRAAVDYQKALYHENECRCEYQGARNQCLRYIDRETGTKNTVKDVVNREDFQAATGELYQRWQASKREVRKAKARMKSLLGRNDDEQHSSFFF